MENGQAPIGITYAIDNGDIAVVQIWLDRGGDPNAMCSDEPDWSLLRHAARHGRAEMISLLLSRGADIDATDADGRTAVYEMLNHWTRHSSLPALRLLLSHGADVNLARTNGGFLSGRSPLMIASICNEQGPTSSGCFCALAPILSIAATTPRDVLLRRKKVIDQAEVCIPYVAPIF